MRTEREGNNSGADGGQGSIGEVTSGNKRDFVAAVRFEVEEVHLMTLKQGGRFVRLAIALKAEYSSWRDSSSERRHLLLRFSCQSEGLCVVAWDTENHTGIREWCEDGSLDCLASRIHLGALGQLAKTNPARSIKEIVLTGIVW
jgi:urease accessory protein UreF